MKIKRETKQHSPESPAGDKYEPGDFVETNCHWKDCGLEFGTQDILVKVSRGHAHLSHLVPEVKVFQLFARSYHSDC